MSTWVNEEFIFSSVQEVEGLVSVKNQDCHPIERFWNEYNRQRQDQQQSTNPVEDPGAAAPASGLDNINFQGKFHSQLAK